MIVTAKSTEKLDFVGNRPFKHYYPRYRNKVEFMGEVRVREGREIKDQYSYLFLVGDRRASVYTDEFGNAPDASGKIIRTIFQEKAIPKPVAKKEIQAPPVSTPIQLNQQLDTLNKNIVSLTTVVNEVVTLFSTLRRDETRKLDQFSITVNNLADQLRAAQSEAGRVYEVSKASVGGAENKGMDALVAKTQTAKPKSEAAVVVSKAKPQMVVRSFSDIEKAAKI